jgi:ABC-type phosphate transport system permease subunit
MVSPYGLRGALWGTILVAGEALALGLPVALSMAIVRREFEVPFLSSALGAIIGTFAGIPPVIYAVMSVVVLDGFVRPKFAAADLINAPLVQTAILGIPSLTSYSMPSGYPNSTFLAGLLLAFLIVPFMAPLLEDALRAVPSELKQGSYALGATRWYTLCRVVLPAALPGIVSAATLGALLAVGEVVIPYFAVGGATVSIHVPSPFWDVFQRTPPLTATGGSLMGGIGGEVEGLRDIDVSIAYVSGVALLLLAFAIMGAEALVLRRLQRGQRV